MEHFLLVVPVLRKKSTLEKLLKWISHILCIVPIHFGCIQPFQPSFSLFHFLRTRFDVQTSKLLVNTFYEIKVPISWWLWYHSHKCEFRVIAAGANTGVVWNYLLKIMSFCIIVGSPWYALWKLHFTRKKKSILLVYIYILPIQHFQKMFSLK